MSRYHAWPKRQVWRLDKDANLAMVSVPFTWNLPSTYSQCAWYASLGYTVLAGGPATASLPNYLADVATMPASPPNTEFPIQWHNPYATMTTRGCPHNCGFCIVPTTDGPFRELATYPIAPIICDNNLLAASMTHFDKVIANLQPLPWVDIQNLDARFLTRYHAQRLKTLPIKVARLAFDHSNSEADFLRAFQLLRNAKFALRRIGCYVLIGYNDTPEDALYRLTLVRDLGIRPNPMRYEPPDSLKRNAYVHPNWTDFDLRTMMRYHARLRYFEHVPYPVFRDSYRRLARQPR